MRILQDRPTASRGVTRLLLRYASLALAVVVLNFLLPRLLPGDPLDASTREGLGPAASTLTTEARTRLRATYHLDQPPAAQLTAYVGGLARGDLGWSISRDAPVGQLIAERLPWTLSLVLTSLVLAAVLGGALGLVSAWHRDADRWLTTVSTLLAALPEFLVAMILLLALAVGLHWFPLQGGRSAFGGDGILDVIWHLTLPAMTLVLATSAGFMLLARGAALGVRHEPYLVAARGKGLSETAVVMHHALPNAVLPVLTLFAVRLGHVLGGALVVERVFAVPGLGLLAFEAIRARDYPILQAIFVLASLGVLCAMFGLELLYRRLSPRHVH